jgi:hypothetical protein
VRLMLRLIILTPLLSGLMMSPYLTHIHITSQTFTVSNLSDRFMSGLIRSFITCVTRIAEALMNGPTSHGREHNAHILWIQDIMLISTEEYYAM